jgi:hypothetical protein
MFFPPFGLSFSSIPPFLGRGHDLDALDPFQRSKTPPGQNAAGGVKIVLILQ